MLFPKLVLLLAACGSVSAALAQRPAVAPLVPVVPMVAAPPLFGADVSSRPPAQPAAPVSNQLAREAWPQPVCLLNSRTIVGSGLAQAHLNPQDIAAIHVYKGADAPAKWRSLAANGIIAITLKPHVKPKLKIESLAKLCKGIKISGPVSYRLENLPIEDLALRVATADVARLDTQPTASGTVVTIHLAVPPPVVHPPGTILIRGASGSYF